MRNIGPKSSTLLKRAGINSRAELANVGVIPAYLMVKLAGGRPSLNLLWAMEGVVQDKDWKSISASRKQQLLEELENLTAAKNTTQVDRS